MNEFALIQRYFKQPAFSTPAPSLTLGIGDDAAILQPPAGQQLVISTDTLVAGRHFPLETSAHAVGWKAAAVNLSDIAAMGATPAGLLLALSLPEVSEQWLADFSAGFFDCCGSVPLIGGDTTKSPVLSITVTALGWVANGQAIRRDGAQAGDLIVVSNTLGDAAYALRHPHSSLQAKLDYPVPQLQLGAALQGYANSMLDISDGLAQDLRHILAASHMGAIIHLDNLPFSPVLQQLESEQAWQLALCGGDDYQLCFTITPQRFKQFSLEYASQFHLTVIGQLITGTGLELQHHGQPVTMDLRGYQHFD